MAAEQDDRELIFEQLSATASKSMFKPGIVALVVSHSEETGTNVMTAGWWMVAGFDPFRYLLAVSHHAYTHEIIETNPEFVLAVPQTEMIDALTLCGSVSGRDVDKIDQLGLETIAGDAVSVPLLKNAVGNIECRVAESVTFNDITYYFADVENAYVQTGLLDGRILSADADPLAYLGSDWEANDSAAKHRYYLTYGEANVQSYPGSEVLENAQTDENE